MMCSSMSTLGSFGTMSGKTAVSSLSSTRTLSRSSSAKGYCTLFLFLKYSHFISIVCLSHLSTWLIMESSRDSSIYLCQVSLLMAVETKKLLLPCRLHMAPKQIAACIWPCIELEIFLWTLQCIPKEDLHCFMKSKLRLHISTLQLYMVETSNLTMYAFSHMTWGLEGTGIEEYSSSLLLICSHYGSGTQFCPYAL